MSILQNKEIEDIKLVIFVHTCKKYEDTRAKLLEETWIKIAMRK
jgi:hypothetical protein